MAGQAHTRQCSTHCALEGLFEQLCTAAWLLSEARVSKGAERGLSMF